MTRSVFLLVEGFSQAERHAMRSMLSLSGDRRTIYRVWRSGATRPPELLVADASDAKATAAAAVYQERWPELLTIWVQSPDDSRPLPSASAVEIIQRPIDWQQLLAAMDSLFALSVSDRVGLDLDLESLDELPAVPAGFQRTPAVLLIGVRLEDALLIRAMLATRSFCAVEEASDVHQGRTWLGEREFAAVILCSKLGQDVIWPLAELARGQMACVFLLATDPSLKLRMQAKLNQIKAVLEPPLNLQPVTAVLRGRV